MNWTLFFTTHHAETLIFVFIFGTIIGSFLNVVIYRYPIMLEQEWNAECREQLNQPPAEKTDNFNLYFPRSHCTHCKKTIPFWFNIPILSFLFLRGKCWYCKGKISIRYFFVEILSAGLSVIVISKLGITSQSELLLIFTWGLIVLSFIDLKHQFLPDAITYILLWIGLIASTQHFFISPTQAIVGAVTGYLFLWAIAKLYFIFRKKEGMGLGDCKMLAMIGAWVGVMSLLNVLLFSTLLALMISLILLACKKIERAKPIPFGPFIAIAGWCTMIYGEQLVQWVARCLQ